MKQHIQGRRQAGAPVAPIRSPPAGPTAAV